MYVPLAYNLTWSKQIFFQKSYCTSHFVTHISLVSSRPSFCNISVISQGLCYLLEVFMLCFISYTPMSKQRTTPIKLLLHTNSDTCKPYECKMHILCTFWTRKSFKKFNSEPLKKTSKSSTERHLFAKIADINLIYPNRMLLTLKSCIRKTRAFMSCHS